MGNACCFPCIFRLELCSAYVMYKEHEKDNVQMKKGSIA